MKAKDISLMAVLGAVLFISQVALSFLPNVELVSLFIIIFTRCFRKKIIGILSVFLLLEILMYGINTWVIMYLYVWPILALISYIFKDIKSVAFWALISGFFGLIFGALCSIVYFFIGGIGGGIAYFIAGIPFDILHCISNVCVVFLLLKPLEILLCKLKLKDVK